MVIDFDCIIILNNSVCQDFLNNDTDFEIVQCIKPVEPKANCFIQTSSVIQCINPSLSDDEGKLKLSVLYKPSSLYRLEYAAILFNKKIDCCLEVRRKNEITHSTDFSGSALIITPSDDEGKLDMNFADKSDKCSEISQMISEFDYINDETKAEIQMLEDRLCEAKQKSTQLSEKKEDIINEINMAENEIKNINLKLDELNDITAQKELLKKNYQNNYENSQKAEKLKNELSYYSEILSYYKDDNGYITASQKLDDILNQINDIQSHIAILAQKRADEINRITDELNI